MDENPALRRRLTLCAALARLVPPGAGPGAVEAGAVDYVAERLAGGAPLSRFLAYGLLRLAAPERVPSVLILEDPSTNLG